MTAFNITYANENTHLTTANVVNQHSYSNQQKHLPIHFLKILKILMHLELKNDAD